MAKPSRVVPEARLARSLAPLLAVLAAVLLWCGSAGGARACGGDGAAVHAAGWGSGAAAQTTALRAPNEPRGAGLGDDEDELDGKPDAALPDARLALVLPAPRTETARASRRTRLSLARAFAFRARQRLDDAFPTGPPPRHA